MKKGGNHQLQYGFIAQEVEKLYPHLVSTDDNGYKSINYIALIPVLTQALKSQQEKIDAQQKQIDELKKLVGKH